MGVHKPYDNFNKDPLAWAKQLRRFVSHSLKKDPGLWLIVGPTGLSMLYAAGMIVNKIIRDPNIAAPIPGSYPDHYNVTPDEMRNTNNYYWPWLVSKRMDDGWKNRHDMKRPEDIE